MNVIDDNFNWSEYDEAPERVKVIKPSSIVDELLDAFYGTEESRGEFLPWDRAVDKFRVRTREVSIYAGINGHYKSTVTSQICLSLMKQGSRSLIASFEMRPAQTLKRMTMQCSGSDQPTPDYIRRFSQWSDDKMWVYDHFGHCNPEQLLAVCRYAARELKVKHLFIDSLMKVVQDVDDYNGQKRFVGQCCALALAEDVHVHLVAHSKKGQNEVDRIDKFSVKGASEISDQVDNLFLVQRNMSEAHKKAVLTPPPVTEDYPPDVFLTVAKQRNGPYEGTLGLWMDKRALALMDRPHTRSGSFDLPSEDAEDPYAVVL